MTVRPKTQIAATIPLATQEIAPELLTVTHSTASASNTDSGAYDDGPALPRLNKVVVLMELVESAWLIAIDESGVVARWLVFVKKATALVPKYQGRILKTMNEGMLVEFDHSRDAVKVAIALHQLIQPANKGRSPADHLFLRIGIHATSVYVSSDTLYGSGVQLAAGLASLAGPGETIASASVRDQLTDGLDAEVDDLGDCFLKHVSDPIRAYRIGVAGPRPVLASVGNCAAQLQPTIAVIPFTARSNAPEHFAIGELIADGVIGQLSRTRELKVISRLSATAFRGRDGDITAIQGHLGADFVLSGSYVETSNTANGKLIVMVEVTDTSANQVLWADRIHAETGDLLQAESELIFNIASNAYRAILDKQIEAVLLNPFATLKSFALLAGGINLMHRSANQEFHTSRLALESLLERDKKLCIANAWLAKWYVLRTTRGLSDKPSQDIELALEYARKAQESNAARSLGLAMEGFVRVHLQRDFDAGTRAFVAAIESNPNEPWAWLFNGVVNSFLALPADAVYSSQKALSLSPIDPLLYYFEALAASSEISAKNYTAAVALCERSLVRNRAHLHTHRALITALWESGQYAKAKTAGHMLLRLQPGYTVKQFIAQSASASTEFGQTMARALGHAGIPLQ